MHKLTENNNDLIEEIKSLQAKRRTLVEKKIKNEREENDYLRYLIEDNNCKIIKLYDDQSKTYSIKTQELQEAVLVK